jgi:4-aminobutyrate aminotransferase
VTGQIDERPAITPIFRQFKTFVAKTIGERFLPPGRKMAKQVSYIHERAARMSELPVEQGLEPALGDGGYVPTPPRFLEGLRERADRHDIVLIVDEVQTGVGRTGRFWGHQYSSVTPDILITAKGIASGFPISAIAASADLMARGWPGSQGGTYGGNAVAAAAAVATLDVVRDEELVANSQAMGELLHDGLLELQRRFPRIGDVRGLGLMRALEFVDERGEADPAITAAVQRTAVSHRLLTLTCGTRGNVVRLIPPLVVAPHEIRFGLDALAATLEEVAS